MDAKMDRTLKAVLRLNKAAIEELPADLRDAIEEIFKSKKELEDGVVYYDYSMEHDRLFEHPKYGDIDLKIANYLRHYRGKGADGEYMTIGEMPGDYYYVEGAKELIRLKVEFDFSEMGARQ